MKYPKANNYLVYKKVDDDWCRIRDYSDDKISSLEVDMKIARFLRRLDGKTSPMKCMPGLEEHPTGRGMIWLLTDTPGKNPTIFQ